MFIHPGQRQLSGLILLCFFMLCSSGFAAQGKLTGVQEVVFPDWFKDSFLDISDDVEEAAESDKHVILFMELNGCPYCAKMVDENFANAPYKTFLQDNFDVIGLNVKGDREVALNEETTATEKEIADLMGVRFTPGLVFINGENEAVVKVNGYRNVRDFKVILDYVQQKAYKTQKLSEFIKSNKEKNAYALRDHPQFKKVADLSSIADKPLALFFEDSGCLDCAALHDGHLAADEVKKALKDFTVVRIDAMSDEAITDISGNKTTQRELADSLKVSYTPSIVLFDKGEEKLRLESMLYRFHFTSLLEYIGARHYEAYPESPFDYVGAKTEKLLSEGKNVSLSE